MRRIVIALVLAGAVSWGWAWPAPTAVRAQQPAAEDAEQDWQGLPPGKGREETFYACAPCHSLRLVTQQGLSRRRWSETLDWMVAKQAMPELNPDDRELILDYLAKHYGEDRAPPGKRRRRRIP
ncbi:MAG: aldehyde dehydrogenase [Alphaproteobacteria bacterium]|nr:aldehyde dehydrogenase [Alphaproteobacteria bacterium]